MQVYLEPYGRPARERLQTLVAEAKAGNPLAPVTVVPPNTYAGIGLRRVLAGDGGLLNVGFMALARLAEQLGAPTMASQHRRPLSAAAEMAVIRTVAMEVVGKEPLGSLAAHSTLHQSLQAAFKEMVRLIGVSSTRWRGRVRCGRPPSSCTADSGSGPSSTTDPKTRLGLQRRRCARGEGSRRCRTWARWYFSS